MIIQLSKGSIKIKPMVVPEPVENVYIHYEYEPNTKHLTPVLYVDMFKVCEGDRIYVNLKDIGPTVKMRVELLNGNNNVVAVYTGEFPNYEYCIIGKKPVRPDLEIYIMSLHGEIARLNDRVTELLEEGEVI